MVQRPPSNTKAAKHARSGIRDLRPEAIRNESLPPELHEPVETIYEVIGPYLNNHLKYDSSGDPDCSDHKWPRGWLPENHWLKWLCPHFDDLAHDMPPLTLQELERRIRRLNPRFSGAILR